MKNRLKQHIIRLTPIDILVSGFCAIMIVIVALGMWRSGTDDVRYLLNYAAVMVTAFAAAPALDRIRHPLAQNRAVQFIRHIYPMFLLGPFFQWSFPISRMFFSSPFDDYLLRADIALFGFNISRDLVHRWGDRYWLTEWLNFSYLSYYWITLYLPIYLYIKKRHREFFEVVFICGLIIYFCFIFQTLFPAQGPVHFDPAANGYLTAGPISTFARVFLIRFDIPGGAMPSGHIAATIGIFIFAWRYARGAFWLTTPIVISLCIATVYCRYHYAVDGIAGIVVALCGVCITGPWLYQRLLLRIGSENGLQSGEATVPAYEPGTGL